MESDLTANTSGTMERDQNGEVAALIKVVTSEQGFVFDGGMTGIVKTKQDVGEVWVYVPHGIKRMTIRHPQLGVLRDYFFPTSIEKAKTYEMVLTTGKVETIVTQHINKQFVVFNVKPSNAIVELEDEILTLSDEGYAEKGLPLGIYNYRVSCTNYHTEAGKLTVSAQNKTEMNISLLPNFGWIKLEGNDEYHGAHVYVDNERVGELPLTTKGIQSGTHTIKVVKNMYKTYEQQVTIKDNETIALSISLTSNFANITFTTDKENEIWIDGKLKSKGSWIGPMEIGEYKVETKRESHRTKSEIVHITELAPRKIQLGSPTPIYGSVEITSNPTCSTVFIDGKEVGETPLILNNVLVGNRELKFVKDGYVDLTKSIEVLENTSDQIAVRLTELPKEVMTSITSIPNHATILIDGEEIGRTPLNVSVSIGDHRFQASRAGYYPSAMGRNVTETLTEIHFNLNKREREDYNDYFNGASVYSEVNIENFNKSYGKGGLLGFYLVGLNLELAYQSNIYNQFDVRLGWGIRLWKNILITPQWGMANTFYDVETFDSYWGYEKENWWCYSFACRIQYCLSKYLALCVSPEHIFLSDLTKEFHLEHLESEYMGGWYIRAGIVLNIGYRWDKIWFNP